MKDDTKDRYMHYILGECIIEEVTPKELKIKRVVDDEIFNVKKGDIVPLEDYISVGDTVRDYSGLETGVVVIEIKENGKPSSYGIRFKDGIKFYPINTNDEVFIRVTKKKNPVLSVDERITACGNDTLIVRGINEEPGYRNYSVEIYGEYDIVTEHHAIFLKTAKHTTKKTDLFTLDGEIL